MTREEEIEAASRRMDLQLAARNPVTVAIGPGKWYQLRGTNVQILIESGPMVHLAYRTVPVAVEPSVVNSNGTVSRDNLSPAAKIMSAPKGTNAKN